MKLFHHLFATIALTALFSTSAVAETKPAPDPGVKLFAYERGNRLFYAWNADGLDWHMIDYGWVGSDYGSWFAEKKMHDPFLFHDKKHGMWYCIFTPNPDDPVFALVASPDLVHWHVQNYYDMEKAPRNLIPHISVCDDNDSYCIQWCNANGMPEGNGLSTEDFKHFTKTEVGTKVMDPRQTVKLEDREWKGTIVTVSKAELDNIIGYKKEHDRKESLKHERVTADLRLPRNVRAENLSAGITVDLNRTKDISPILWGIFFEDINYSADGGLYAELVRNRDFEFNNLDHGEWNALTGWSVPSELKATIATDAPIHKNNPHYLVLESPASKEFALVNEGFRGMVFRKGDSYFFSVFTKNPDNSESKLKVEMRDEQNQVVASGTITVKGKEWTKTELKLTASKDTDHGKLALIPSGGKVALDMVSLFPQKTWKGRKNGLRPDLMERLAAMKPAFVRFPGGCVAHGNGLKNMYRWNRTVGALEARVPQSNIWDYHQSAGLGYFEYFQFCEDIGAEPLPILPAGVSCQNSFRDGKGQQGGIPMDEMDEYIQEVLDLIEWANGPADSKWGKVRAEAGHPEPFHLKYIGIGNEDLISDVFAERYIMIIDAVRAKHPEITIVGTVGPTYEGSDYEDGWALARKHNIPLVDEHYYQAPGWFLNNQNYYDTYERGGTRVYLGEYASHNGSRTSTIETALTEAIHMISLERNGDVVAMASYAPLLAKEGDTQWNPDLIYFNNTEVKPTTGYFVQKLFGNNAGDRYARTAANLMNRDRAIPDNDEFAPLRKRFASSCVIDSKTSTVTIKIVNLLPFEVNTALKLDNLGPASVTAVKTVLSGNPDDMNVRPSEPETITLMPSNTVTVPAFSLTVLSFPVK